MIPAMRHPHYLAFVAFTSLILGLPTLPILYMGISGVFWSIAFFVDGEVVSGFLFLFACVAAIFGSLFYWSFSIGTAKEESLKLSRYFVAGLLGLIGAPSAYLFAVARKAHAFTFSTEGQWLLLFAPAVGIVVLSLSRSMRVTEQRVG